MSRFNRFRSALPLRVERLEDRTVPSTAYLLISSAVNPVGSLVQFDTDNPTAANFSGAVAISGTTGERILGIDFRPATGVLYGMSEASKLYTINPLTGVATQVGAPGATTLDAFGGFFEGIGFDFNPTVDAIRVTEDDGTVNGQDDNFAVDPNTGVFTQQTDLNDSGTTNDVDVVGAAYTNSFPGATTTTLYGIEINNPAGSGIDRLVIINPPASGNLTTVDSNGNGLGVTVFSEEVGFDILSDPDEGIANRAFATLEVGLAGAFGLYQINLTDTGDATLVGNFTVPVGTVVRGLALVQPDSTIAAGTAGGIEATARTFDTHPSVVPELTFDPFPGYQGQVSVAVANFNNDGVPDLLVGAGVGTTPHIKVFDGATQGLIASFFAYAGLFQGGVFVAAGDVNGDRITDIITGAGAGAGPHVKVINGAGLNLVGPDGQITDPGLLASFYAFDPAFAGGVRVAAGDVNGDGFADIIAGAGSLGGHVKAINGQLRGLVQPTGQIADAALLASFFAYPGFNGGVFVASGDIDADGRADIVTGAGNAAGHVKVFSGRTQAELRSFFAFPSANGVRVATTDANGDGVVDIVAGMSPGQGPQVRTFDALTLTVLDNFLAFDAGLTNGIFVG